MGFSWKHAKEEAIKVKIRRAIIMATAGVPNPDFKIRHPEWIQQAQSKNFSELKKKITEETKRKQDLYYARIVKNFGGKN